MATATGLKLAKHEYWGMLSFGTSTTSLLPHLTHFYTATLSIYSSSSSSSRGDVFSPHMIYGSSHCTEILGKIGSHEAHPWSKNNRENEKIVFKSRSKGKQLKTRTIITSSLKLKPSSLSPKLKTQTIITSFHPNFLYIFIHS